jgi:hypothetical protein
MERETDATTGQPSAPAEATPPEPARKPYTAPRLTEHGQIARVTMSAGSGFDDETPPSDRALKEGFAPVDRRDILARAVALPLETWSYRGETARHLGPMAQDFAAAFGLGADDRRIHVLDANGVALAAIQGLHAVIQDQAARLAVLERQCAELRRELRARRAERPEPEPVG